MSDIVRKNLGSVTAYKYAVSKGYTGTEEDFAELMASYATVAEEAEESANTAAEQALKSEGNAVGKQNGVDVTSGSPYYHNNAKYYAGQAASSASSASTSASAASSSAASASGSASTASTKASAASTSATTASNKAAEASSSATSAAASATAAAQSATAASGSASAASTSESNAASSATAAQAAQTAAETAQTAAETAQGMAEDAQAAAQAAVDTVKDKAPVIEESISGSIASFPDGADNTLVKSLVVGIEPVQSGSGDPSPDNVRPISGWTSAEIQRLVRFLTWTLENGSISDTGEETSTGGYYRSNYIDIQDAKNINLNFYAPAGGWVFRIVGYNDNEEFTSLIRKTTYSTTGTRNITVDVPDNVRYIRISIKTSVVINRLCTDYSYFEIAFPTEADTVYGGTLDVTNGVLTNKWRYETFATLSAAVSYSEGMFYFEATSRIAKNNIEQFLCSKYANYGNYPWATLKSSMPDKSFGTTSASARKYVCFKDSTYSTVADFMAANADTQIAWESVQEYWSEYQLTPTEVRTLLGENNIFADTGDIVDLEYRADTKLYIDRLTAPDSDMIADANITSGSYFMVNNSLYIATAAIAAGETIVPGTNCTLTNLAAALNALNA